MKRQSNARTISAPKGRSVTAKPTGPGPRAKRVMPKPPKTTYGGKPC